MSNSKATLLAMIPVAVFIFLVIGLLQCNFITVDADAFQKEKEYTKEELLLFADFAFPNDRIRKYDEDIRVVIKNKEYLNDASIHEVDSIIAILAPLVHPIKIYRVEKNGNLVVTRNKQTSGKYRRSSGCENSNLFETLSWSNTYSEIYDTHHYNGAKHIFKEFEHALGLDKPARQYPFYTNINSNTPQKPYIFRSFEESDSCMAQFYISEQEKMVIKMLYSPAIKSGLRKEEFMKQFKLS